MKYRTYDKYKDLNPKLKKLLKRGKIIYGWATSIEHGPLCRTAIFLVDYNFGPSEPYISASGKHWDTFEPEKI